MKSNLLITDQYIFFLQFFKLFERILFKQLFTFFHDNKLLYNSQYGFRKGHSTEYATLKLVDRIILDMENKTTLVNIYIDTLDHYILIKNLEYYGLHGTPLQLMYSCFTNTKQQFVEIYESKSDILLLPTEVPQGSILGPLLFIIYINDICHSLKLFNFDIYTNDTTLTTIIKMVIRNSLDLMQILSLIRNYHWKMHG